ncbi:heavy metal translocating P-type ATPase [Streptomyces sp. NPDC051776]|uniref:heavy metal translocating P-type ATPase n=1 Tax=Streptomyces sp. NPDC051776 TaxID=3155414 RepID=UPI003416200D
MTRTAHASRVPPATNASSTGPVTAAEPATVTGPAPANPGTARVELAIGGMTCAACAARVEKKLNRMDGVSATVNFATEKAVVTYGGGLGVADLIATVERTGYTAAPPPPAEPEPEPSDRPAPGAQAGAQPPVRAENGGNGNNRGDGNGETAALRRRFTIAMLLGLPVVLMAMVPALQFDNWQWLSLTLASPVVVWGGLPFHRAAWTNARHGAATMDTLVSLGTLAAFGWSLWALFLGHAGMPGMRHGFDLTIARTDGSSSIYLEVAAGVTVFLLLGRYLEAKAKRRAGAALRALLELGARDASLLHPDGREERIPVARLAVGDRFVVRPGEKVATDGRVVEGASAVDASMLTGESVPADVTVDGNVTGGTVNVSGRLVVEATRIGSDTQLARMARLVEDAQNGKAEVQRLADRISGVFVPAVLVVALGTLVGRLLLTDSVTAAFSAAVAVLIIACPCALGLATPTALMVGTGRGAQLGILIKGPEVLESTRRVDTVVLDKTGTVTTGRMAVREIVTADAVTTEGDAVTAQADAVTTDGDAVTTQGDAVTTDGDAVTTQGDAVTTDGDAVTAQEEVEAVDGGGTAAERELLRLAGSLEHASEHPVGRAIAAAAVEREGTLPAPEVFENVAGLGVQGVVEGRKVLVGRGRLLEERAVELPERLAAAMDTAAAEGQTAVAVAWDGRARGVLTVADGVKESSAEAVAGLRRLGLTPVLLTGDNRAVAESVAREVGIDEVMAEVLPEEKVDVVRRLQREGRVVAMVGDGVNDAAALAAADLGLAMGTGTDAAIEAGDLTLVRGDLRTAPDAIRLSRRTLATIKGNLVWAFGYNVAALPLAAAGLLNPMIAGAAMAFSSIFVVTNSLRLRNFR